MNLDDLHLYFLKTHHTLSLAESCTGGLLSSHICKTPGASHYYLGSVVSYAESAKINILKVRSTTIDCLGEVSLPTALEMARGAKEVFKSDYAVSITGIAGPSGGTPDKPVGTVCFAVVGPGFSHTAQKKFSGQREEIQLASAEFALQFLWDSIHK